MFVAVNTQPLIVCALNMAALDMVPNHLRAYSRIDKICRYLVTPRGIFFRRADKSITSMWSYAKQGERKRRPVSGSPVKDSFRDIDPNHLSQHAVALGETEIPRQVKQKTPVFGYCDSDFASRTEDRKSGSGFIFFFHLTPTSVF